MPRSQPARPPGPPYTRVALCVCVPLHPLAMVDAFLGTWKLVDTANFDEYMKALGEWGGLRGGGGLESRHHPLFFLPPPSSPNLPGQAPCTRGSGWGRLQAVGGSLLPGQGGLWGALGLYAWGLGWGKGALVLPLPPSRVQPSAREWMPPPGCREPPRTLSASPPTPAPELPITQPQLPPCFWAGLVPTQEWSGQSGGDASAPPPCPPLELVGAGSGSIPEQWKRSQPPLPGPALEPPPGAVGTHKAPQDHKW